MLYGGNMAEIVKPDGPFEQIVAKWFQLQRALAEEKAKNDAQEYVLRTRTPARFIYDASDVSPNAPEVIWGEVTMLIDDLLAQRVSVHGRFIPASPPEEKQLLRPNAERLISDPDTELVWRALGRYETPVFFYAEGRQVLQAELHDIADIHPAVQSEPPLALILP